MCCGGRRLTTQPDGIEVVVEDDGRGFQAAGKGHGIASMRRRAAMLGGALDVSGATPGARVTLRLPMSAAANRSADPGQAPDQVHRASDVAEHS